MGARSNPLPTAGYTSLVHGCEAKPTRANGIHLAGLTILDAVCGDGGAGYIYLAGSAAGDALRSHRGRAYESRSLMKGRPSVACVGPDNLEHIGANVVKYYIADIGIATDDEYGCATWGHSCTPTLGFLVGHAVGSNVPPTQVRS